MNKILFIPLMILLSITSIGCNIIDPKNEIPIEMVAFNSLTLEEQNLIPVSPKDSIVEKVTVNHNIKLLLDNNYDSKEVYTVTFNHTDTNSSGNLIVLVDLDKKTVVGKGDTGTGPFSH